MIYEDWKEKTPEFNDLVLFGAPVQIGILKRKRLRFKTCRVQAIISSALRSYT